MSTPSSYHISFKTPWVLGLMIGIPVFLVLVAFIIWYVRRNPKHDRYAKYDGMEEQEQGVFETSTDEDVNQKFIRRILPEGHGRAVIQKKFDHTYGDQYDIYDPNLDPLKQHVFTMDLPAIKRAKGDEDQQKMITSQINRKLGEAIYK